MLREKGRPRSTCIRNEMDWRERGESPLCGLCRNSGHNRATCLERRRQPGGYLTLWTEKDVRQTRVQKTPRYFIYRLSTALSLYGLDMQPSLISALVERWRPETHTFHTTQGDCTITLEDVAIQLGLLCTGMVVTGLTEMNLSALCEELLGIIPPPNKLAGQRLSLAWLAENFTDLAEDANDAQVQQFARAYILRLIGGYLMPDKSSRNVYLMYLPLLNSFEEAGKLSWGSAVLAYLYREFCRGTHYDQKDIGGCMMLLHLWMGWSARQIQPTRWFPPLLPDDIRFHASK
ncbi:serine/threonine-protein phosphatase 7 long form-like protein [Senna tora]|uniref:Serine/threonine-protein phosphatase 7 long form-like protein n=1 Tax=Senna tora TaxID=362788 RepID=A0A834W9W0_9FABA|nr:serine/threonine-protein phosphatase 7 long form-like protein [Senna tora]